MTRKAYALKAKDEFPVEMSVLMKAYVSGNDNMEDILRLKARKTFDTSGIEAEFEEAFPEQCPECIAPDWHEERHGLPEK